MIAGQRYISRHREKTKALKPKQSGRMADCELIHMVSFISTESIIAA
ncbi:MAG: hypothetical protein V7K56_01925 [Nostoc sp.]